MGTLFVYISNRRSQLSNALTQEFRALAPTHHATPDAWGMGFFQGGELLHKKRPWSAGTMKEWKHTFRDVRTGLALLHLRKATVGDFRAENTQPFRSGAWTFAHNGTVEHFDRCREAILASLPSYRRRSIRGTTDSECIFQLILAALERRGQHDLHHSDKGLVVEAIKEGLSMLDAACEGIGSAPSKLNIVLTNGDHCYALRRGLNFDLVYRREGEIDDALSTAQDGGWEYLFLASNLDSPAPYQPIESNSILCISRSLERSYHRL